MFRDKIFDIINELEIDKDAIEDCGGLDNCIEEINDNCESYFEYYSSISEDIIINYVERYFGERE